MTNDGNQSEMQFNSSVKIAAIFETTDTVALQVAQAIERLPQENVDIVDIVRILINAYGHEVAPFVELELEYNVKGQTVESSGFTWKDI